MSFRFLSRICPPSYFNTFFVIKNLSQRPIQRNLVYMQHNHRSILARFAHDMENASLGDVLLTNLDFPDHYQNMAHPDDYKLIKEPLSSELFYNTTPRHWRILCRVSFKLPGGYYPLSFVCDTGAPGMFYFCEKVILDMTKMNVIKENELGTAYIDTTKGRFTVDDTAAQQAPANIIGLSLLKKLGLVLDDTPQFMNHVEYF